MIDLSGSHVWDASTVAVLDAIETKYQASGKTVEIVGMNESSQRMRGDGWVRVGGGRRPAGGQRWIATRLKPFAFSDSK